MIGIGAVGAGRADARGRIYATGSYMDRIEMLDSDYRFQHVLGAKGKMRKVVAPGGISIDASDRLFVAEMLAHNRVYMFSLRCAQCSIA